MKKRSSWKVIDEEDQSLDYDPEDLYFKVEDFKGHVAIINIHKDGSRWHEKIISDKYDIIVHSIRYMGYLTKHDLMEWLHRDYEEVEEITREEAIPYKRNKR